jgi:membrane-associated protein
VELIAKFIDYVLHLNKYLPALVDEYGGLVYLVLFAIIFMETGLVVTPFLPGDSLLFAAGAVAGLPDSLNVWALFFLLWFAAVIGDNTNYWIGRALRPRMLRNEKSRFIRRQHLDRTHAFFEKYGTKAIIIARFVPIVRTFMPFVAGVGAMTYRRFLPWDIFGGLLWVGVCVFAGYLFGQSEFVQKRFSLVIVAIIVISVLPAVVEFLRHRAAARSARQTSAPADPAPGD